MKKILIIPLLLLIVTGCSQKPPEITEFDYFYFDTSINVKIYDDAKDLDVEQIDSDIDSLLQTLEKTYSPALADSTINQVNDHKITEVDDQFISILNNSIAACEQTGGQYDPSSGALIDLWSINNENHLPSQAEIDEALKLVGCQDIKVDGNTIDLPEGYRLDFGSSAKGFAGDQIAELLTDAGVENALINLGGNIQAVGDKYGNPFNISVMTPETDNLLNESVVSLPLSNTAMVTSGINQRFFTVDGNVYHHIIDAKTGYPADNGLASVSIVTPSGADADILSTMVFLMGLEDGYDYIQSLDGVDAIFITRDKKIYQTKDFGLQLLDDSYTIEEME